MFLIVDVVWDGCHTKLLWLHRFTLFVVTVSPVLSVELSDVVAVIGDPVGLRCSAMGIPSPEISWLYNV